MLRALIVDDERLARVALRSVLDERGDVEVVGEADGVAAARRQLEALKPDVVFLDVQMPGGSGFELFTGGLTTRVVFCTAYEQYAVRAFEVNALDYLVKPVSPEQVDRALKRLSANADVNADAQGALALEDLVALREAQALRFARVADLAFIRAADDYSEVHLVEGKPALVDVTLRRWEARLPAQHFVRIHRSTLVNLHHVERVESDEGRWQVVLKAGTAPPLPVSRRMGRELRARLERAPA
jgi:two-component system LytT family response regulator